jgi:hypothetical protein
MLEGIRMWRSLSMNSLESCPFDEPPIMQAISTEGTESDNSDPDERSEASSLSPSGCKQTASKNKNLRLVPFHWWS